jgi:hypothetical protein
VVVTPGAPAGEDVADESVVGVVDEVFTAEAGRAVASAGERQDDHLRAMPLLAGASAGGRPHGIEGVVEVGLPRRGERDGESGGDGGPGVAEHELGSERGHGLLGAVGEQELEGVE